MHPSHTSAACCGASARIPSTRSISASLVPCVSRLNESIFAISSACQKRGAVLSISTSSYTHKVHQSTGNSGAPPHHNPHLAAARACTLVSLRREVLFAVCRKLKGVGAAQQAMVKRVRWQATCKQCVSQREAPSAQ